MAMLIILVTKITMQKSNQIVENNNKNSYKNNNIIIAIKMA